MSRPVQSAQAKLAYWAALMYAEFAANPEADVWENLALLELSGGTSIEKKPGEPR